MSVYLLVCRYCISNQWIAEEIDEEKFSFLFLMNPEFHNKKGCEKMVIIFHSPFCHLRKLHARPSPPKSKTWKFPFHHGRVLPLIRAGSGFLSQYSDESYRYIL